MREDWSRMLAQVRPMRSLWPELVWGQGHESSLRSLRALSPELVLARELVLSPWSLRMLCP